jgi:anti-sigma regulatory factor (Ser/Thr protein kinase)
MEDKVEFIIQSKTGLIEEALVHLGIHFKPFCLHHGINQYKIKMSLREALDNAIIHGNLEISTELKEKSWENFQAEIRKRENSELGKKPVKIRYQSFPDRMEFEIEDKGKGLIPHWKVMDFSKPEVLLARGGRGIAIISCFMDEIIWNETGNIIRLVKYLENIKETE